MVRTSIARHTPVIDSTGIPIAAKQAIAITESDADSDSSMSVAILENEPLRPTFVNVPPITISPPGFTHVTTMPPPISVKPTGGWKMMSGKNRGQNCRGRSGKNRFCLRHQNQYVPAPLQHNVERSVPTVLDDLETEYKTRMSHSEMAKKMIRIDFDEIMNNLFDEYHAMYQTINSSLQNLETSITLAFRSGQSYQKIFDRVKDLVANHESPDTTKFDTLKAEAIRYAKQLNDQSSLDIINSYVR